MSDISPTPELDLRKELGDKGGLVGPSVDELLEDSVTGLKNRLAWTNEAEDFLLHSRRSKENIGLVLLDLNRFKAVNDTYGHNMGDEVLKAVSDSMRETFRGSDILGRFGGDEFVALLPGYEKEINLDETNMITDKILSKVREGMSGRVPAGMLGVSIGLVKWDGLESLQDLIIRADGLMYKIKGHGR